MQASEFYVQGIKDRISKTSECLNTFKDRSDLDLLNNTDGWENIRIVKGTLLQGVYKDAYINSFTILQTMACVEIDTDSDDYQALYLAFTSFKHLHLNKNEHNNYVRTVCTEQAGRPEESSDLKGSVNLMSLHPSRRRAVAAQPDAGIERGLKTHQVSGASSVTLQHTS